MEEPQIIQPKISDIVPTRSDESTVGAMEELRALTNVMESLRTIANDDGRARVLRAAATFFKVSLEKEQHVELRGVTSEQRAQPPAPTPFSEERLLSAKDFLREKQPRTDVERVACLAYYLTHYQETPHFKTIDISKLNTEAAQPKLSNAAMAVDNATKSHYLVPAAKGNKQISASGELFVQALPDRDLARQEMSKFRPKKKRKSSSSRAPEDAAGAE